MTKRLENICKEVIGKQYRLFRSTLLIDAWSAALLLARVSAVNSGRLRFGGLRRRDFPSKLKNKIITLNLHHFVFLFLTVCNFLHLPVISVPLLFRWVV